MIGNKLEKNWRNKMADRLLTKQEFRELQPSISGVETIVLQAQDLKTARLIIEEIEGMQGNCDETCAGYSVNDGYCEYYFGTADCSIWQQFKERILK